MNNWFGKMIFIANEESIPDAVKVLASEGCFVLSISNEVPFYIVEQIPQEIVERMSFLPSEITHVVYSYCFNEPFKA